MSTLQYRHKIVITIYNDYFYITQGMWNHGGSKHKENPKDLCICMYTKM